jgi:ABC-type multidrug transport system fused ATPase/permease subunit
VYLLIHVVILFGLSLAFYAVFVYFQKTNLSLKRLMAVEKSPLVSCTSQTIDGLLLLKAFKKQDYAFQNFRNVVDGAETPTFHKISLEIWVDFRLGLLASLVMFGILVISITMKADASAFGLALVNALGLSQALYVLLLKLGEGEAELNAVERLYEYGNEIPKEKARELPTDPIISEWPTRGEIQLSHLDIRYNSRPDRSVIHDFNATIRSGEKIGICGRTGSGKSTLATALFRVLELHKGTISIDGLDISALGLSTLRSRIQMIPQEPILFNGTIRYNLDPEGTYDDESLWHALQSVGLKEYVQSLEGQLDSPIVDNGGNVSYGQKQLMCIARAVLRKPKILVMDEASSAVDQETETIIQETVMNQFPDGTIISIAHRLHTIAQFDKIMVIGDGELLEYDTPRNLLETSSEFSRLVDASGISIAELIRTQK